MASPIRASGPAGGTLPVLRAIVKSSRLENARSIPEPARRPKPGTTLTRRPAGGSR